MNNPPIDQITVGGTGSSPTFDHMDISAGHCGFHFNDGANITVTNSNLHDLAVGAMILASVGTKIDGTNFLNDQINVGTCTSGDVTLTGDYLPGPAFDASCNGQTNNQEAGMAIFGTGPRN